MKTLPTGLLVYECKDWGARPPAHDFYATKPSTGVVHHTADPDRPLDTSHNQAVIDAFALSRQIQAFHMDDNGWSDTGQHFTITRDGICLEGRHGSLAALLAGHCIRGAHAADGNIDFNDDWGVEHEGNYMTQLPPDVQWQASVKLFAAICFFCKIDSAALIGHRDTGISTACPGDALHAKLPTFRTDVHTAKLKLLNH